MHFSIARQRTKGKTPSTTYASSSTFPFYKNPKADLIFTHHLCYYCIHRLYLVSKTEAPPLYLESCTKHCVDFPPTCFATSICHKIYRC